MKRIFSLLLFAAAWSTFAQPKVESEIKQVTVYKAGATVERSTNHQFQPGRNTYLFTGVPQGLMPSTIQVQVPSEVNILSINYRFMTAEELGFGDLTELGEQIAQVEAQILVQNDIKAALREDLDFIAVNSDVPDESSAAEVRNVDAYLGRRRREIRSEIRSTLNRIEELQAQSQELRSQMAELEVELGKPKSVIEVETNASRPIRGEVSIQYFVNDAQWIPFYNIRSGGVGTPVEFEFMASIRQNTGEDWDNVALKLSTSDPATFAAEPDIEPWTIGYREFYVPTIERLHTQASILRRGTFYALIKDEETQRPLPNARVELSLNNDRFIATSNEKGEVTIGRLNEGTYSVRCYFEGYQSLSTSIAVSPQPALNRISLSKTGASRMLAVTLPQIQRLAGEIAFDQSFIEDDLELQSFYETSDVNGAPVVRGTRSDADVVFIDGVKVRGSTSIPQSAMADNSDAFKSRNFIRVQQALGSVYSIDLPFTVPSTGMAAETWISTAELPAEYIDRFRPARSESARLIARIPNWEQLDLIQAAANLYVDNSFNGTIAINPQQTGDTLELSLGIDQGIRSERNRIDFERSKGFWSGRVEESFTYQIKFKNTRPVPVSLSVQEQFPISTTSSISVTEKIAEGGTIDEQSGRITWNRTLQPNEEWVIEYSFIVTYPGDERRPNLPY
ncbi:MAG: mucoidy inhibitor MuiA family protein [Flavobacteriia bacterium]|nr:mucoidy inhibitor MuiA family protein [Flavobacteriia bacterium]